MPSTPPVSAEFLLHRIRAVLVLARADLALCRLPGAPFLRTRTCADEARRLELLECLRSLGAALIHVAGVASVNQDCSTVHPTLLSPLLRRVAKASRACAGLTKPADVPDVAQLALDALLVVTASASLGFSRFSALGTHGALVSVLTTAAAAAAALRKYLLPETSRLAAAVVSHSRTRLVA